MIKIHLSRLLGEKRISQTRLCKLTGIRPGTINDLYHEMAITIKIEHINKICKALGCKAHDLIEYIPDKKL